ncbi:MAG: glycerophosphodiester phosphodiesterase family protein [Bacteroidota bacterium]
MNRYFYFGLLSIILLGCTLSGKQPIEEKGFNALKSLLHNARQDYVLVVAHRGDWRNAPENSIPAIKNCIKMGVDMVELDVRLTKDSIPILMHDKSLDRTTTGSGKVSDYTLDQIKTLFLRDGLGRPTEWKIPTLEEAMIVCKDQILVNLDKSDKIISLVYPILKKTSTVDHVAIGSYEPLSVMRMVVGNYLDSILFMPKIKGSSKNVENYLNAYFSNLEVPIVQIKFETEDSPVREYESIIKSSGKWLWLNTITSDRSANHHDNRATYDLEGSYGWVIESGFNMIQTDRPRLLIDYLKSRGLH